jgi:hypothetical protein
MIHEDCRIPEDGTLIPILSQFYMLRLINADPNVKINVIKYKSGGKTLEEQLDYDFPIGNVIEKFSFPIINPVPGAHLSDIIVDGIVCRSDENTNLPGKDAGDQRANGLLIVDDKDAVFDLTFLPQYEGAPYLNNIFGIIRLTNIRDVFEWFLNNGKDSPLTVTRDGFDQKHEFTKRFFNELEKYLNPIYQKEKERHEKAYSSNISEKTQQKINQVLKELNKYLKQLGDGGGTSEPPETTTSAPSKVFQFLPEHTKLIIGKERVARLYFKKGIEKPKTTIIYDTSNDKIEIKPLSQQVDDGKKLDEYLEFKILT